MEDKEKGKYNSWTQDETKVLIELLVEGIKRGWRDSSGIINKATVENKILPVLNERVGCQKLHKHYQSRIKFLKNLYNSYAMLIFNVIALDLDGILKQKGLQLLKKCGKDI